MKMPELGSREVKMVMEGVRTIMCSLYYYIIIIHMYSYTGRKIVLRVDVYISLMLRFRPYTIKTARMFNLAFIAGVTNQEGSLKCRLFLEAVGPELQVSEPLPRVLRQLAHLAVCVGGQRSRPGGDGGLLIALMLRHPIGRLPSVLPALSRAAYWRLQRW